MQKRKELLFSERLDCCWKGTLYGFFQVMMERSADLIVQGIVTQNHMRIQKHIGRNKIVQAPFLELLSGPKTAQAKMDPLIAQNDFRLLVSGAYPYFCLLVPEQWSEPSQI